MIRVQYQKLGDISYISHLDIVKLMERISRRAGIKLSYSQGFSPHPKTSFSPALSVGMQSYCEYIDLELEDESISLDELIERYNTASVEGIIFTKAKKFEDKTEALMSFITHSKFEFEIDDEINFDSIMNAIDTINSSKTIMFSRISKSGNEIPYDMKEYIEELSYDKKKNIIKSTICTSSAKTLNPRALLSYILTQSGLEQDTFTIITKTDTYNMNENGEITRAL